VPEDAEAEQPSLVEMHKKARAKAKRNKGATRPRAGGAERLHADGTLRCVQRMPGRRRILRMRATDVFLR
jgi:hypothetical protein